MNRYCHLIAERRRKCSAWAVRHLVPVILLMLILLLFPVPSVQAELWDHPGRWQPEGRITDHQIHKRKLWNSQDIRDFTANLRTIRDLFVAADPSPLGVDRKISLALDSEPLYTGEKGSRSYYPVSGYLLVNALSHFYNQKTGKVQVTIEGPIVQLSANTLGLYGKCHASELRLKTKDGTEIYCEPLKVAELQGFPLYDTDVVVMTRSQRPLWLDVTRGEYLLAMIHMLLEKSEELARDTDRRCREFTDSRTIEENYGQLKAINPTAAESYRKAVKEGAQRCFRQVQAELPFAPPAMLDQVYGEFTALSPDESRSTAWIFDGASENDSLSLSKLVPEEYPGARRLVRPNPGFFDTRQKKGAVQVLMLQRVNMLLPGNSKNMADQRQVELINRIDWGKLLDKVSAQR